jgi:F0F1-type ATP synthase assembly protein I
MSTFVGMMGRLFKTPFRGATVQRFQDKADISSIGLEMGGCVIAGYFIGTWLDGRFDLAPWGTIIFLVFGFGAALKGVIRVARKARALAMQDVDSSELVRPRLSRRFREVQRSW